MTTHSSILAWKIPRTEEPGGLQSMGSQRIGHDLWTQQYSALFKSTVSFRISSQTRQLSTATCQLPSLGLFCLVLLRDSYSLLFKPFHPHPFLTNISCTYSSPFHQTPPTHLLNKYLLKTSHLPSTRDINREKEDIFPILRLWEKEHDTPCKKITIKYFTSLGRGNCKKL